MNKTNPMSFNLSCNIGLYSLSVNFANYIFVSILSVLSKLMGAVKKVEDFFSKIPSSLILAFLNVFAIAFYFFLLKEAGYFGNIDKYMLSTGDANEYFSYTKFLAGQSAYCNPNRPFFYPLLLLVAKSIGGIKGIWVMQFAFWLISCNLSFLSVQKMGAGRFWAIISFLLLSTYLSAILLTAHALTEITVLFLLSILTYTFSCYYGRYNSFSFGLLVLLIVSTLFAVKPFFQIPMVVAIAVFIIYHAKNLIARPIRVILFIICLMPALIQYGINKTEHKVWNSSKIAEGDLRHYFMNKVEYYAAGNVMDSFNYLKDSVYKARDRRIDSMPISEVRSYLIKHLGASLAVAKQDIIENVASPFPYIGNSEKHDLLLWLSYITNRWFYRLHHIMLFLILIYFLFSIRRMNAMHFYFASLGFMSFLSLIATSITFWAGDRLVVPSMAVWCVLYTVFISHLLQSLIKKNAFLQTRIARIKKSTSE